MYIAEHICYDDACHLRKFAGNQRRKDLTEATKKLVWKLLLTGFIWSGMLIRGAIRIVMLVR